MKFITKLLFALGLVMLIIGVGESKPQRFQNICPLHYNPQCGFNGVTYGNRCQANGAVSIY